MVIGGYVFQASPCELAVAFLIGVLASIPFWGCALRISDRIADRLIKRLN